VIFFKLKYFEVNYLSIFVKNYCIDITISPEEDIINLENETELKSQLLTTLSKLPKRQQEAIHLKYMLGLDSESISKIMNITNQTLRNTLHSGINSLRENLKPNFHRLYNSYTSTN